MSEAAATLTPDQARNFLRALAGEAGEYCGLPYPLDEHQLVLHRNHPLLPVFPTPGAPPGIKVINSWVKDDGQEVVIYEEDGRRQFTVLSTNPTTYTMEMLGVVPAWDLDCEMRAMEKLKGLLKEHIWKQYLMTGAFIESSKRSQVTYIFRRLRPTLALSPDFKGSMRILCALCLHPLGYYGQTFAGAMVPTDDVISHLLLMRADEPYYWRKANQIPAHWPQAAVIF